MSGTSWRSLEDYVRSLASLRWGSPCRPEHIEGVDFDGVIHVSPDEIIIIEITKERDLDKVRADINKIMPIRLRLAANGLICRGFIVLEGEPTNSMEEMGRANRIPVCSAIHFGGSFFDFQGYNNLRKDLPFGSATNQDGVNDPRAFVQVRYSDIFQSKSYGINEISTQLERGEKIVLTGDYGTGKSRCVREVYSLLATRIREAGAYPIAINLREHWSSSNALEIIAGHLGNVGLSSSVDNLVRLLNSGHLILLLDGFDEIGTQIHDIRIEDRKSIRRHAVRGVRDLISRTKCGVLITGRSHFFDSPDEMLDSLGLGADSDAVCLEAPDFFTEEEGNSYLASMGVTATAPSWLPRKPLVFQMLVELDPQDVSTLLSHQYGQFEFWGAFLYAVCKRESKGISGSIAPQTIYLILQKLAGKTRYSATHNGRLSPSDIDSAYQAVVGSVPDQNGRQLLARMCTLGRIEPESPDRQFLDADAIDVLRAEALTADIAGMSEVSSEAQWVQSLRTCGIFYAAQTIRMFDLSQHCFAYLKKFGNSQNTKRLGEIVSLLTIFGDEPLDFQSLQINNSTLPILNLSQKIISNLTIKNSEIYILILNQTPIRAGDALNIDESIICNVAGVSSALGLPEWIKNSGVISYERISNATKIRESALNPSQKLFLAIVHKIFFQAGNGREESALLKGGYGQKYSPRLVEAILKILMREGLIDRFKGDNGWVYKPIRRFSDRMNKIRSELTLSSDPVWKEISNL